MQSTNRTEVPPNTFLTINAKIYIHHRATARTPDTLRYRVYYYSQI